jgi:NAD(P)H-flavin reductase
MQHAIAAAFSGIEPVARDTVIYTLELASPLPFVAGQFVNLAIPGAAPRGERSYSIYSDPKDGHRIRLCVKLLPGGVASTWLAARRVGDEATVRGPYGAFTLDPGEEAVFMVATATGLAPFHAMLDQAAREDSPRAFRLYFGVREEGDLFALDDLQRWKREMRTFDFHLCLSRAPPDWSGWPGRVTGAVARDHVPGVGRWYVCGNTQMVEDVRALLRERGHDRKAIRVEKYY